MFKFSLLLVVLALVCFGCKESTSEVISTESKISVDIESSQRVIDNFSDIVYSYDFIKLQTKGAPLIGDVKKIFFNNNAVFIQDALSNKVILFDTLGNYKRSFGTIGEGPAEYRSLDDFVVDIDNERIYLLDGNSHKICVYDLNGNFIKYFGLSFFCFRFEKYNNKFVFVTGGDVQNNLYVTNQEFKIIAEFRPKSVKTRILIIKHLSTVNDSVITYSESLTDTIFRIREKKVEPYLYVDSGAKSIGKLSDEMIKAEYFRDNRVLFDKILEKYHVAPDMFVSNGVQSIFMISDKDDGYIVVYDKTKNDYRVITKKTTDDIGFTAYPCSFRTTFGDRFVGIIPSFLLINVNFKYVKPKLSNVQQKQFNKIKELAIDMTESSNPIIVLARIKITSQQR